MRKGFSVLPVVILVALVGLMIPTVKYVTDVNRSYDTRSRAAVDVYGNVIPGTETKPEETSTETAAEITARLQAKFDKDKADEEAAGKTEEESKAELAEQDAATQRWQGIADNIDEIEAKREEIKAEEQRQQDSQTIIQQTSPDVTQEGQLALETAPEVVAAQESLWDQFWGNLESEPLIGDTYLTDNLTTEAGRAYSEGLLTGAPIGAGIGVGLVGAAATVPTILTAGSLALESGSLGTGALYLSNAATQTASTILTAAPWLAPVTQATGLALTTATAVQCELGDEEACNLVVDAAFGLDYGVQQAIAAMPPDKVNRSVGEVLDDYIDDLFNMEPIYADEMTQRLANKGLAWSDFELMTPSSPSYDDLTDIQRAMIARERGKGIPVYKGPSGSDVNALLGHGEGARSGAAGMANYPVEGGMTIYEDMWDTRQIEIASDLFMPDDSHFISTVLHEEGHLLGLQRSGPPGTLDQADIVWNELRASEYAMEVIELEFGSGAYNNVAHTMLETSYSDDLNHYLNVTESIHNDSIVRLRRITELQNNPLKQFLFSVGLID